MQMVVVGPCGWPAALIFRKDDCNDKGKPAARQGRKAVSLLGRSTVLSASSEIVWLPKAVGESHHSKLRRAHRARLTVSFLQGTCERSASLFRITRFEVRAGTIHVP